jgi:nucleoside-triphosphatase THEP1
MASVRRLKIIFALVAFVALFISNFVAQGITIILLLLISFKRLCVLKTIKFWLGFILISFVPYLFLRSAEMLHLSTLVFCRSIILYLAFITIAENISTNQLSAFLPKIIGKQLAITLTLAFNLLPIIRHILLKNYGLFYLRNKINYPKYKQFCGYALSIFRQIINAANCCAENMLLSHEAKTPHIVIITGYRHCGKTSYALGLIKEFQAKNWPVSGIVAPSSMQNNRRSTIYVKNISTSEKKLLASRDLKIDDSIFNYGDFDFSASGYAYAKEALLNYTEGGIVFLDEFGPMELSKIGYANEFEKLTRANVSAIFVVVRREILDRFYERFSNLSFELIDTKIAGAVTAHKPIHHLLEAKQETPSL